MSAWWPCVVFVLAGCTQGPLQPVAIDTVHDTCENCRMVVSDARFAAEVIAPGEEPRVFDDLGCLHEYLTKHVPPRDAVVFVTDHRTGAWIEAVRAVYTRSASAATPMGSRILAHASATSRDADPLARNGTAVPISSVLEASRVAGVAE